MKHDNWWIVLDQHGAVEARVHAEGRIAAERMAWAIFPELENDGLVIGWYRGSNAQRAEAKRKLQITAALCVKQGTAPVDHWAGQLRKRFVRAGGAS